jgi:hypothetical protein
MKTKTGLTIKQRGKRIEVFTAEEMEANKNPHATRVYIAIATSILVIALNLWLLW